MTRARWIALATPFACLAALLAGCSAGATPSVTEPVAATPPATTSSPAESASPSAAAEPKATQSTEPKATQSTEPKATQSTEPKATQSTEPRPVPATLKFSAKTVDGHAFDGASLQGRPVLLWFWAPWCPTCRGQLPEVQRLAKRYDGKVAVIGIGSLDSRAAIARFANQADGPTHLVDERGAVWRHFDIVQQSSFVLLDADGKETFRAGYGGSPKLADEVAAVAD